MGNPQKSKGQNGTSIADIAGANNGNNRKFDGQNVQQKTMADIGNAQRLLKLNDLIPLLKRHELHSF